MEQLVGSACVICQQSIGSVVEGRFCDACESPVHKDCMRLDSTGDAHKCFLCGAQVADATAVREHYERKQQARARPPQPGKYAVGRLCPACGHEAFDRVRPNRWIAYGSDRLCRRCGTRYIPPTPVWAGLAFLLVGLSLLGIALYLVGLSLVFGDSPGALFDAIIGIVFTLLGVLAVVHGVRSLWQPGKV